MYVPERSKMFVGSISACDQKNLGRRTILRDEMNKILIVGHDNSASGTSFVEDCNILGITKAKRRNGLSFYSELLRKPWGEMRRTLGIDPKDQATTTG